MRLFVSVIFISFRSLLFGQASYLATLECGFLKYVGETVMVKPGPNWKGYNLNERQNGIDLNLINSIKFSKKHSVGLGVGIGNFEGYWARSIFLDFQASTIRRRGAIFNFKFGQNHLWNQYQGGQKSVLAEIAIGGKLRLKNNMDLKVQTGPLLMHKALIIPVRLGINFNKNKP